MAKTHKGILINTILNLLEEENKRRNIELCKQNLYSSQVPFDRGDMFFRLAFMPDDEVTKIASMMIG